MLCHVRDAIGRRAGDCFKPLRITAEPGFDGRTMWGTPGGRNQDSRYMTPSRDPSWPRTSSSHVMHETIYLATFSSDRFCYPPYPYLRSLFMGSLRIVPLVYDCGLLNTGCIVQPRRYFYLRDRKFCFTSESRQTRCFSGLSISSNIQLLFSVQFSSCIKIETKRSNWKSIVYFS